MKKVIVGLSGGVDSSVAAYLLKKEGYEVIGLFMDNWKEETDENHCTGEEDYNDVKTIARVLDIPYYSIDFSKKYYDNVFKHFLDEYKKGRTPNPDVLCNKEIKFDVFFDFALKMGADFIATGHYADIETIDGKKYLKRAVDENKDQTYFLNQLSAEQIERVLFPLAKYTKEEVREIAKKAKLPVADKKDSTGICFIGERHFRDFLKDFIPMKEGEILDKNGEKKGVHSGAFYYTIGQRKGLGIGGAGSGEPWFVYKKDVKNNRLYVVQGEDELLYHDTIEVENFNFITERPNKEEIEALCRIRHRQKLQAVKCKICENNKVIIEFDKSQRGVAEGQYAVVYNGLYCLGGGTIEKKYNRKKEKEIE